MKMSSRELPDGKQENYPPDFLHYKDAKGIAAQSETKYFSRGIF